MRFARGLQQRIVSGLALLALLAIFAQGLIPAGAMPDAHAGLFRLTICSGVGLKTIEVAGDRYNPHAPAHEKMPPCPFAVAAHMAVGGGGNGPALFVILVSSAVVAWDEILLVVRAHRGNAGPRAPPALS